MRKDNEIYCNKCGKRIGTEEDLARGEMLHVEKSWGYFSKRMVSVILLICAKSVMTQLSLILRFLWRYRRKMCLYNISTLYTK